MAGGTKDLTSIPVEGQKTDVIFLEYTEDFAAPGVTDALRYERFIDGILMQVSGTATACTVILERSTRDPLREVANWAPVEDVPVSGNLAVGIAPTAYIEPSRAWWRARISELTGGTATIYLVGKQG